MKLLLPFILVLSLAACENKSTYTGKALPPDQGNQQVVTEVTEQPQQPAVDNGKLMLTAVSNTWSYADIVCWDAKNQQLFVHWSKKEAEEHQGWWLMDGPYPPLFVAVGNNTLALKKDKVRHTSIGDLTTTGLECIDSPLKR